MPRPQRKKETGKSQNRKKLGKKEKREGVLLAAL
jgi:hypothetical protein